MIMITKAGDYGFKMRKEVKILKVKNNSKEVQKDVVVEEFTARISFNDEIVSEISCTPNDLDYLAIGTLYAKGLMTNSSELKLEMNGNRVDVTLLNKSEIFKNHRRKYTISVNVIFKRIAELLKSSALFEETGGCHMVGVFDLSKDEFLYIAEDISRHSAVEKCIGYMVSNPTKVDKPVLFASGRANSRIVEECAMIGIPIVITKSAVTDKAIESAEIRKITLIGFVRGRHANIYTHPERVEI